MRPLIKLEKKGARKSTIGSAGLASGQLSVVIGFLALIILTVGLLSFEIGRLNLADQQLQNAVDAAALTAAATLASESNSDPTTAHNDAIQTALNLFKQNQVMGSTLTNTTIVSNSGTNPGVGNATIYFQFLNPVTHAVENISSPTAKIVNIQAAFGLQPAFAHFLGINNTVITAQSSGAVPKLDIVVCFDISGSMDDQTPVTIVKRQWDSTLPPRRSGVSPMGKIVYDTPPSSYGTSGTIFNILQPGGNGTSFNGVQPQYLSYAINYDGLYFSLPIGTYYGCGDLRSGGIYPDAGVPPGNYPPGTAYNWDGSAVFTHAVVNIDGNTTFGGITSGGYPFPDVATLVEAATGNLENAAVFNSSQAWTSVAPSVNPKAGYQAQYLQLANALLQPMNNAKTACTNFMNIINSDTDAHFGFVSFDSTIGSSPTDTESVYNIDQDIFVGMPNYGVSVAYPRPFVPLNPAIGNSGYSTCQTAVNACISNGGTNMGAAIQAAVNELTTHQRQGATRAIVLFTDGQPTNGGPLDTDPWMNARDAAVLAKNAGIPVYTVGLAQDTTVASGETTILNDTNNSVTTGGIAAISGHGATFNLVSDSSQLTTTFENIARCLVELVGSS